MNPIIELIIQKFLSELRTNGYQSPKSISFPKRTYNDVRQETAIKGKFLYPEIHLCELIHRFGADEVLITRAKCKECGE